MTFAKNLILGLTITFAFSVASATVAQAQSSGDEALQKRGKLLFLRCRSCHNLKVGEPHKVGPNLNGVFGAASGSKDGFKYSDALADGAIEWSETTLDQFIKKPAEYAKGTKMAFIGLRKPEDRMALIAYLKQATR